MDEYKHESEEIFQTAISKFMGLKLEEREDSDTLCLFIGADNLWKEIDSHGETGLDRMYKDAVIRAIPTSYIDVKFAVHRDNSFFF